MKQNSKRLQYEFTHEEVDNETGEIKRSISSKAVSFGFEPEFVKLYVEDIALLLKLPVSWIRILLWICKHLNYASDEDGMCIGFVPVLKQRCMIETEIKSMGALNNALSRLNKLGVLERLGTGLYRLNPYIFGKGKWKDISKIRMVIDYGEFGRRFKAVFEKEAKRLHKKKGVSVGENNPKEGEGVSDKPSASDAERLGAMLAERLGVPLSAVKIGEDEEENPIGKVVVHEEGEEVS